MTTTKKPISIAVYWKLCLCVYKKIKYFYAADTACVSRRCHGAPRRFIIRVTTLYFYYNKVLLKEIAFFLVALASVESEVQERRIARASATILRGTVVPLIPENHFRNGEIFI